MTVPLPYLSAPLPPELIAECQRDPRPAFVTDDAAPAFGSAVAGWHWKFAWLPVETFDRGWRWLGWVQRRRIQKHYYLTGGADFWWQYRSGKP